MLSEVSPGSSVDHKETGEFFEGKDYSQGFLLNLAISTLRVCESVFEMLMIRRSLLSP